MPKRPLSTNQLVESDFRIIQKLVREKVGKEYSLDYIRKVCKKKRKNEAITLMAEKYVKVIREMESKIENLSHDQHESS